MKNNIWPYALLMILVVIAGISVFYILNKSNYFNETPASGIEGSVIIAPTCPVQRINETCEKPHDATIVVKTENGRWEVTSFQSDKSGRFQVNLKPGKYLLVPLPESGLPHAAPRTVEVEPDKYTEIRIEYDSGIR